MPFTGDTFAHLFSWDQDPQRQEKLRNSRLEAEFDGIDTALTTVKGTNTALAAPQYAVAAASSDLANERVLTDTATVTWDFTVAGQAKANAAGGAPADAQYVTLATNGTLTNERVLTAGPGISITDGGAGAAVTVSTATGTVLQVLQDTYVDSANLSTVIPLDDTPPQSGEGTEVLSQAITPADATNKVLCIVDCWGSVSAANSALIVALFRGTTCINVASHTTASTNFPSVVSFAFLDSPASASAQTYSVRVGPNGAATHVRLNGSSVGRQYGGAASSTLTVMEVAAT